MSEVLISATGVSKKFCRDLKRSLWYGFSDLATEVLRRKSTNRDTLRPSEFWALKDVDLEVKRGETLALLGRNGAGKTTLLRILTGLIRPDGGSVVMRGRIGAMIALGAGFNPILTGRENIYVNGAILGFSKREIGGRLDQIIEFSEVGEFIDAPVQSYSSGMQVRLGFSIAATMEPDILLIDEVLAVGDAGFRTKCYNRIFELQSRIATVFVSHSMAQVGKVCNTGLVLSGGAVLCAKSQIAESIDSYLNLFDAGAFSQEGSGDLIVREIVVRNDETDIHYRAPWNPKNDVVLIDPFKPVTFFVNIESVKPVSLVAVLISFTDIEQKLVAQALSERVALTGGGLAPCWVSVSVDEIALNTGRYTASVHLYTSDNDARGNVAFGLRNVLGFAVMRRRYDGAAPILYNSKSAVSEVFPGE